MGRKRHTPEQNITALREAEVGLARGKSVKLISRELGITEQTYYDAGTAETLLIQWQWWTRSQRLRTLAQIAVVVELRGPAKKPI